MLYFKSNDEKTPLKKKKSATDSNIDLSGIEFDISIDSKYNATSQNAQSGEAVAQAVAQSLSKLSGQVGSVLRYKGSVNSQSNLNSITSKEIGDVYDVKDTGNNYVWTSNGWDKLSEDLTNLVKENTFNTLNTQVRSHISNRDTTAKHLDAETYQKLNDTTVYSSEQLDALIEEVLQSYVDSGDLVTEKFLEESLADIETKIEESIIQNVQTEARNSFLTNQSLEVYKDEIAAKKKGYIKSEQANILDIYAKGDNRIAPALANRKDKTLYIIGDGAEIEQLDNIIYLYITTTTNNQAVNLGYNLGRWEQTGVATEIRHRGGVDWGDNSAITEFDGTEGIANSTANSLYHVYTTPNTYQIKISGVVKWSKVSTSSSNSSTPNSIREVLTRIEIPTGKKSPLYYIDTYAFYYCKNLELIPDNLFDSCTQATNFSYCFSNTQITKIPERLFDSCTQATNFSRCFQNTQITEIPQGLFDSCTQARDFSYCFYNTKITAIPQGLFDSCTQATDFSSCFFMTKITTIPQGLFDKCTQAKDFSYCFQNAKITIIPERLFDKCTQATNFSYCFGGTQITEIPQNLFAKNNAVTNFSYTFNNCSKVKGNLPTLWNTYPTVTHDQCFCGCRQADNYQDAIVAGWTCPDDEPYLSGTMILTIKTTSLNQVVNLGYNLGRWENTNEAGKKIPTKGTVKFDDNLAEIEFNGSEGITEEGNKLVHTYENIGEHRITIKGIVKWNKVATSFSATTTPNSICDVLTQIEIPEEATSPLQFIDEYAFSNCRLLTSIPAKLFENCTTVTHFNRCFNYCSTLAEIPAGLFDKCTKATYFNYTFSNCRALKSIPNKLFDNCILAAQFAQCFYDCKKITAIPTGLFDKCPQVNTFSGCFEGCNVLAAIPSGLFNNCSLVRDFYGCFRDTAITSIPEHLFDNCPVVTTFSNCFNTSKLKSIPNNLFDQCTKVTTFEYCFSYCDITSIPDGLFVKNTATTEFSNCFEHTDITSIPENLFSTCTQATDFWRCFKDCNKLTAIPQNLFAKNSAITDFGSTFKRCTAVKGNLPALWETYSDSKHDECFCGCTQATNYNAAIKAGWTCPNDVPEPDGAEMILKINIPALGTVFGSDTTTFNIDLGPILGIFEGTGGNGIVQSGTLDWGDGSSIVNLTENMGRTNASLKHDYKIDTNAHTYDLKITGNIKWNTTRNTSGISTIVVNVDAGITWAVDDIIIPEGKTSPICAIAPYAFYHFINLKNISENLLDNCKPTSLEGLFEDCERIGQNTGFSSILPANLFAKCGSNVTNVANIFKDCAMLKEIPAGLFDPFINVTNFSKAFYNDTAITENLPTLWESHQNTIHEQCFYNCTKAVNYSIAQEQGWA